MLSFLSTTRAEEPARKLSWGCAEWAAVLMVVALIIGKEIIEPITGNVGIAAAVRIALRVACAGIAVYLFRDLLKRHWHAFTASLRGSLIVIIVGIIVVRLAALITRAGIFHLIPALGTTIELPDTVGMPASWPTPLLIICSTIFFASSALIEELAFRHTLLLKLPAWSNKVSAAAMLIVNGAIFGLLHAGNYGGLIIMTLPHIATGMVFACLYLWTRNIWHVVAIHFLCNISLEIAALVSGGLAALFAA